MRRAAALVFAAMSFGCDPALGEGRSVCFRGEPVAECRSWTITDAFIGPETSSGYRSRLVTGGELGWMRNLTARDGCGLGIAVTVLHDFSISIRPRYRRSVGSSLGIDAGPGLQLSGDGARLEANRGVMHRHLVGI